jgi:hypothetical protein
MSNIDRLSLRRWPLERVLFPLAASRWCQPVALCDRPRLSCLHRFEAGLRSALFALRCIRASPRR